MGRDDSRARAAIAALGDTLFPSASLAEGLRADTTPTAHVLIRRRVLHPFLALLSGVYLSSLGWLVARVRPDSIQSPWSRAVSGLVLIHLGGRPHSLVVFSATALTAAPVARSTRTVPA